MGRRLDYAIVVSPALRPFPVPPMMLLTLVENAMTNAHAEVWRDSAEVCLAAGAEGH